MANTKVPPRYPPRLSVECKDSLDRSLRKERESIAQLMGHDELILVEPYEIVYNVENILMTQFKLIDIMHSIYEYITKLIPAKALYILYQDINHFSYDIRFLVSLLLLIAFLH